MILIVVEHNLFKSEVLDTLIGKDFAYVIFRFLRGFSYTHLYHSVSFAKNEKCEVVYLRLRAFGGLVRVVYKSHCKDPKQERAVHSCVVGRRPGRSVKTKARGLATRGKRRQLKIAADARRTGE